MTRYICWCIMPCLLVASPAAAQTCLGAPSFMDRAVQVGFLGAFSDTVQTGGVTAMGGGDSGFGGIGYEFVDLTNAADPSGQIHSHDVYGRGGGEFRAARVAVCPIGELHGLFTPSIDGPFGRVRVRGFRTFGGAQAGVIVVDTSAVQVIPTIGGGVVYDRVTLTNVDTDAAATMSETSGLLQFGVGVIFNQRMAITPMVRVPFGVEDPDDVEFRVMATFGFGG